MQRSIDHPLGVAALGPFDAAGAVTILYYCIPPGTTGQHDAVDYAVLLPLLLLHCTITITVTVTLLLLYYYCDAADQARFENREMHMQCTLPRSTLLAHTVPPGYSGQCDKLAPTAERRRRALLYLTLPCNGTL